MVIFILVSYPTLVLLLVLLLYSQLRIPFFMYNRIVFGGSLSQNFSINIPDLNKREFIMLGTLVAFTIFFGVSPYPAVILDGLHYSVSTLIYNYSESSVALLLSLPVFSTSGLSKIKPFLVTGFAFLTSLQGKVPQG